MAQAREQGYTLWSLITVLALLAVLTSALLPSLTESERSLDARLLASDLRLASDAGLDAYRLDCGVTSTNTLPQLVSDGLIPLPVAERLQQQSISLQFEVDNDFLTTVVSGLSERDASSVASLISDARVMPSNQIFIRLYSGVLRHKSDTHLVEYTSLWGTTSC